MVLALALLLGLRLVLEVELKQMVAVVVADVEEFTDCEAAVDTLEDLEVLLDWEGEVVYVVLALTLLLTLGLVLIDEVKDRVLVVVPNMDDDTNCDAAVDALEDLEVLLDWEGEAVKDGEDAVELEAITLIENEDVMHTVGVDVTLKLTEGVSVLKTDPVTEAVVTPVPDPPTPTQGEALALRDGLRDTEGEEV